MLRPTVRLLVLQHTLHDHLDELANVFQKARRKVEYLRVYREGFDSVSVQDYNAIVAMGGPMSANDEARHPFLTDEIEFLEDALYKGVPVLGICLGAQLLARALDAKVYPAGAPEIGWHPIQMADAAGEDPLFKGFEPEETVFQWHGETFDLPSGAVRLAGSEQCPNQAFVAHGLAYGLQFHIEMGPTLIEEWLSVSEARAEIVDFPDDEAVSGFWLGLEDHGERLGRLRDGLGEGFLDLVSARS